jgi:predicted DNA-binding protein with PD1-like motif
VRGGHFLKGIVRPTLEVILTETPARLRRKKRDDLGTDRSGRGVETRRRF